MKMIYEFMVTFCLYSINNFPYNTTKECVKQILTCTDIAELPSLEDFKLCPSFTCIGRVMMLNLITG